MLPIRYFEKAGSGIREMIHNCIGRIIKFLTFVAIFNDRGIHIL